MTSSNHSGTGRSGRVAGAGRRTKPTPGGDGATAGEAPSPRDSGPWEVRLDVKGMAQHWPGSLPEMKILLAIEDCARCNPYAYPGLHSLGKSTGLPQRTVQAAIKGLEDSHWIMRVFTGPDKKRLLGFVLLRRTSPRGTPAADTPERVAAAEHFLRERYERGRRPERRTVRSTERSLLRSEPLNERGGLRQNKDSIPEQDEAGRKDAVEAPVRPSASLGVGESRSPEPVSSTTTGASLVAQPSTIPTFTATPAVAAKRNGPGRDSQAAIDLEAWASTFGGELAAWARRACDDYPAEWIGKVFRDKVADDPAARTPEKWKSYLRAILEQYLLAGKHEHIPNSSLVNPLGLAKPAAASSDLTSREVALPADPFDGREEAQERRAVLATLRVQEIERRGERASIYLKQMERYTPAEASSRWEAMKRIGLHSASGSRDRNDDLWRSYQAIYPRFFDDSRRLAEQGRLCDRIRYHHLGSAAKAEFDHTLKHKRAEDERLGYPIGGRARLELALAASWEPRRDTQAYVEALALGWRPKAGADLAGSSSPAAVGVGSTGTPLVGSQPPPEGFVRRRPVPDRVIEKLRIDVQARPHESSAEHSA